MDPTDNDIDDIDLIDQDPPRYDGWLVSPSFLKRALAIYGHLIVLNLLIWIPLMVLALILGMLSQ